MEKYRDIIGRINYGLFLAVVFLLPFPQTALRYLCTAWIITWVFEFRWLSKPQADFRRTALPFIAGGLWFVWQLISGLWAADHAAWSWQIERYLTFILLVPVGLWGVNSYYNWRQAGKALVMGCIAALPFYLILMTALYIRPDWIHLLSPDAWDFMHPTWWTYFSGNISAIKHRLFLCTIELFGAYMAFLLYRKRPKILIPAWIVMLSFIPLTDSRQAIFLALVLSVIMVLYALPEHLRSKFSWTVVVIGLLIGGAVLKLHPRMEQVNLHTLSEMKQITYDHEARLNIWTLALEHPSDYLPWGLGAGQSRKYLINRYNEVGLDSYADMRFHAHNQYLEEMMETGFVGLVLLLIMLIAGPVCARGQGQESAVILTTLFGLNMFIDCMFGLFCGIALWAVGLVLIALQSLPSHAA